MDKTPTVSVIIPTFKRPVELLRAVNSVLEQDYTNFEILVVDDNQPESEYRVQTESVLKDLDSRIIHLKNSSSLGGAGARNVGIESARGSYVAFLDDDDQWLPGKLGKQMALFDTLSSEFCSVDTGFFEIDERKGSNREILPALRGEIFEKLLVKHKGRAPKLSSMVCRTAALRGIGLFDSSLPSRQDLDLYLRLARLYKFEFIAEPLVNKFIHSSGRISSVSSNKIRGFEMLYKKYYDDLVSRPVLHRKYLKRHAFWLAKGGKFFQAGTKILKSLMVR